MHRRATSKKKTKEPDTEEDRQEHEIEAIMDSERKRQTDNDQQTEE